MSTHEYERSQRFLLLLSSRNTALAIHHRGTATRNSVARSIPRLHRAQSFLDTILQRVARSCKQQQQSCTKNNGHFDTASTAFQGSPTSRSPNQPVPFNITLRHSSHNGTLPHVYENASFLLGRARLCADCFASLRRPSANSSRSARDECAGSGFTKNCKTLARELRTFQSSSQYRRAARHAAVQGAHHASSMPAS